MGTLSSLLVTGHQALQAQQTALHVTGNNIANVNTPGYTRERPELRPVPTSLNLPFRGGVNVEEISRAYDRFVTAQVNDASSAHQSASTQADVLEQIEALFNDLGSTAGGLSGELATLFNDFQAVAQQPQESTARQILVAQGETVASAFRQLAEGLDTLRQDRNTALSDAISEVNQLSDQIAALNVDILKREIDPKNPANTLRDQQDVLIKQLAEHVNISTFAGARGQVTVLLGGRPLVEGQQAAHLTTHADPDDAQRILIDLTDSSGNTTEVTSTIRDGSIHGLLEVRDGILPRLSSRLDRLAAQLTTSLNTQHSTGYGLDGTTGQHFFTPRQVSSQALAANTGGGAVQSATVFDPTQLTLDDYRLSFTANGPPPSFDVINDTTGETIAAGQSYTAGAALRFDGLAVTLDDNGTPPQNGDTFLIRTTRDAAKRLALDSALQDDPRRVAAAKTPSPGENTNALALADLRDATVLDDDTFGVYYQSLVGSVGSETQRTAQLAEQRQTVLSGLENRRESLSGVSLDEEQVNLIRFQQAYNAAAQFIRIASELGQTVLELVR
ncbi:MAG: flagellar hook-associated protein FlgK [Candidatus Tectimicrobiota bacterium]